MQQRANYFILKIFTIKFGINKNNNYICMALEYNLKEMPKEDQFKAITENMLKTFIAKNYDYGNSFEESCDNFGIVAAVVRMNDKMNRINHLYDNTKVAKVDEKLEDTLLDLANYCILTVMYLNSNYNKKE